jgi:hypothetical protein
MNIFGAFTFGSLIKTFLPGVVWLLALGLLEADIAQARNAEPFIWSFVKDHEQASLVLAFPAAILLGLMSNIVVFMGVNDRLVRNPVRKKNAELFLLYDLLATRIRDHCWTTLALGDTKTRQDFDAFTDVEIIMLPTLGLPNLAYVREQYWYHLEFQMNLLLSLVALFMGVAISAWTSASSFPAFVPQLLIYLILFVPMWAWLLRAARKNYCRHTSKMLSLLAGVLCPQQQKPEAKTRHRAWAR